MEPKAQSLVRVSREQVFSCRAIIRGIDINENSTKIAAATDDHKVVVFSFYNRGDDFIPRTLTGHTGPVLCVSYNEEGSLIASGGMAGELCIFQPNMSSSCVDLKPFSNPIRTIQFSYDSQVLLAPLKNNICNESVVLGKTSLFLNARKKVISNSEVSIRKTLDIIPVGAKTPSTTIKGHKNTIRSARFSPCDFGVVSGGDDKTMKLWDTRMSTSTHTYKIKSIVNSVAFHPSGLAVAASNAHGNVFFYDVRNHKEFLEDFVEHKTVCSSIDFHINNAHLLTGYEDGCTFLSDMKEETIIVIADHKKAITATKFSQCGSYFATAGADRKIFAYSISFESDEESCFYYNPNVRVDMETAESSFKIKTVDRFAPINIMHNYMITLMKRRDSMQE